MADNRRVLSVTIDRAEIRSAAKRKVLFTRLSGPLQTPVEDLEARYTDVQYDPYLPLPLADDVPETTAIYLGERREDYPGVEVSEGWQRVYRYAPLASHIVGYMGAIPAESAKAYKGQGLQAERAGGQGRHRAAVRGPAPGQAGLDHLRGRRPQPHHPGDQPAGPGPGQRHRALDRPPAPAVRRADAAAGPAGRRAPAARSTASPSRAAARRSPRRPARAVVEDPRNGQILAMATYPTFDNRWFVEGISNKKIQELYPDADKQAPFVNRAVSSPFQMGSTFKLVTTVAGLQSGIITPGSPYNDQGKLPDPELRRRQVQVHLQERRTGPRLRADLPGHGASPSRPTRTTTASAPSCSWPRTRRCRTSPGSSATARTAASTCRPRSRGRCPTPR